MTTILEEFKRLDAARRRGDIAKEDLVKRRQELSEMVEEAELACSTEDIIPADPETERDPNQKDLLRFAVIAIAGLTLCFLIGAWIFSDPILTLTLGVTVLAAVVIRATQELED